MNWELQPDGGWAWEDADLLAHVTPLLSAGQLVESIDRVTGERRALRQEYRCRVWRGDVLLLDVLAEHEDMGRHACEAIRKAAKW